MGIPALNQYSNAYINNYEQGSAAAKVNEKAKVEKTQTASSPKLQLQSPDQLITKKERDFFVGMFPDNSEQLSKHVLFNKNGKLQNYGYAKGTIIDGRA